MLPFAGSPAGAVDPSPAVDAWAGAAETKLRQMTALSRAAMLFKTALRCGGDWPPTNFAAPPRPGVKTPGAPPAGPEPPRGRGAPRGGGPPRAPQARGGGGARAAPRNRQEPGGKAPGAEEVRPAPDRPGREANPRPGDQPYPPPTKPLSLC